jgi:hypothetical protein
VNRDRKLTVLESLLERVRGRASASRVVAPSPASALSPIAGLSSAPATSASTLAESISSVAESPPVAQVQQQPEALMAAAEALVEAAPPPRDGDGASVRPVSERPQSEAPTSELDEEEGPPSAPRLREGLAMEDEEEEDDDTDHGFQDDEGPIKTPPPESGRQHVASPVPPTESSDDLDVDISITVTDAELSPSPPSPAVSESSPPESVRPPPSEPRRTPPPTTELGLDMGPPRLAFVSEPEIDLHVRPRPPAPVAQPSAPPIAGSAFPPIPTPSSVPPSIRVMAQPAALAPSQPAPPVEVWASTHAPAALRGQVATFVGQNAGFAPKSFGELLDASLQLGES